MEGVLVEHQRPRVSQTFNGHPNPEGWHVLDIRRVMCFFFWGGASWKHVWVGGNGVISKKKKSTVCETNETAFLVIIY